MARRAGGGLGASVYAAVFFALTTIAGAVLAILAYGELDKARDSERQAKDELAIYVKPAEKLGVDQDPLVQEAKRQKKAVIPHVQEELRKVKDLIGPNAADSSDQLAAQLKAVEKELKDRKRLPIDQDYRWSTLVKSLDKVAVEANNDAATRLTQIENAKRDLDALAAKLEAEKKVNAESVAALQKEIDQHKTALDAHQREADKKHQELVQASEQAQVLAAEKLAAEQKRGKALEAEIARLGFAIKEVRDKLRETSPQPGHLIDHVDGNIIAINPDEGLCYINLGKRHHLRQGLTFEVYDRTRGVEAEVDAYNKVQLRRGKATIEVVEMQQDSAVCRIVRQVQTQTLLTGDLVANVVYDPKRVFKFFVFGDFDLDNDGRPTLADRTLVSDLIKKWGGKVVNTETRDENLSDLVSKEYADSMPIPFDVDYIVVGVEPEPPAPLTPEEENEVDKIRLRAEQKKLWEKYQQLVDRSRVLSVPIVNQHRFLDLVGYYR